MNYFVLEYSDQYKYLDGPKALCNRAIYFWVKMAYVKRYQ